MQLNYLKLRARLEKHYLVDLEDRTQDCPIIVLPEMLLDLGVRGVVFPVVRKVLVELVVKFLSKPIDQFSFSLIYSVALSADSSIFGVVDAASSSPRLVLGLSDRYR